MDGWELVRSKSDNHMELPLYVSENMVAWYNNYLNIRKIQNIKYLRLRFTLGMIGLKTHYKMFFNIFFRLCSTALYQYNRR